MEPLFKLPGNIHELHSSIVAGNNKLGPIPNFSTLPSDGWLETADGRKICETVGTCAGVCYECKDQ